MITNSRRFFAAVILAVALVTMAALVVNPALGPEGVLFVMIQLALLLNWPVAVILWYGVSQDRRERSRETLALVVMAVAATLIAVGLTAYVWAVINATYGYVIPREIAQLVFRLTLLGLALFPLWFLWLFVTGRFRDR